MTSGFFWMSSGRPSAIFCPKSSTMIRDIHHETHVVLDHNHGDPEPLTPCNEASIPPKTPKTHGWQPCVFAYDPKAVGWGDLLVARPANSSA